MSPKLSPRAHAALDRILAGTWRADFYEYSPEEGACYEVRGDEIVLFAWSAFPPQTSRRKSEKATAIYREMTALLAPFEELTRKLQHEGLDAVSDAHYAQAAKTALDGLSAWPQARKAVVVQALHVLGYKAFRSLIGEPDQMGTDNSNTITSEHHP